ncbi:Auxin response factor 1 [Artemisia annua]|uniref:Auxin response factor 1 n=1 Tax=Artemisia annua TaxID=35608 RepID=A0A2U1MAM4_ARTAN|nr:Auxin response factor 1 [Artemisia annua]
MAASEGCLLLVLAALINVFGGSKKEHYPKGFQPVMNSTGGFMLTACLYVDIEAYNQQVPVILLPPKILCKVVNVKLWVENAQVYAQITLLPHQDQSVVIPDLPVPEPLCCNVCSFCKAPTACDASAPGGLRKHTYLSVLATARHAVTAGTRFNVIYRPRFVGKIVAVGDDASSTWPDSEWKSVKVQWDKQSTILPDKVSPWELELKPSQRFKWSCCLGLKRLCCCGQKVAY